MARPHPAATRTGLQDRTPPQLYAADRPNQTAYEANLAGSLNNLSSLLADAGHRDEAARARGEAIRPSTVRGTRADPLPGDDDFDPSRMPVSLT